MSASRLSLAPALALLALAAALGQEAAPPRPGLAPGGEGPPRALIEWTEVAGARAYELEIRSASGETVFSGRAEGGSIELALPPGAYSMRVVALNVFLKPSSASAWMELSIVQALPPRPEAWEPRILPAGQPLALLEISGEGVFRGTRIRLEGEGLSIRGESRPAFDRAPEGPGAEAALAFGFELGAAKPGAYDLVLENPGGMRRRLPAALLLLSREDYWLRSPLPALPFVYASPPEPPPALGLGQGPVELARFGGGESPSLGPGSRPAGRPLLGDRPLLCLAWTQGHLLDQEFSYLYGPSNLGAALGLELPLAALFPPPAFLRGASLEARLGFQRHEALLSAGTEGSILFGRLGGGPCYGLELPGSLGLALRAGAELELTSLDSANPFFPGSLFSLDPAVYAGAALRLGLGGQRLELGLEWSGTFYLDFFMNRLRAGLGWQIGI